MRIAIMQPYFIPYAGYFRLFCAADLFVIYDCVQFIRRGWVHRNRLPNTNSELQWLTLPLKKAPQDIQIKNLDFIENKEEIWQERLRSFPQLFSKQFQENVLFQAIQQINQSVVPLDFIVTTLKITCEILGLPFNVVYSSSLNLSAALKGEERIIEIARHFGAKDYINPPGGRELYHSDSFKHHNIGLFFLSDYHAPYESILQRLLTGTITDLKKEITEQSKLE